MLGRTQRVSFAEPGAARTIVWQVDIAATSGGSQGTLRVTDAQPSTLERSVKATSCEQVVDALALVASLSVDPEASLAPRAQPKPAPATAPQTVPATSPATAPPPRRPRSESVSATRLSLGLTLTGRAGIAPQLAWAPRLSLGLSFRSLSGHAWGLALSATQVRGNAALDIGQADFTWSLARLELFPVRATYGHWRLEPAAFVEGGQLRARGIAVSPAAEVRRPALWVGALGRLSFLAFDLLWFALEAGASASLLRDRFYLFENATIFRVPAIAGYAGAGVGLEFL